MDQQAFRKLISTPSTAPSATSSSTRPRLFGAQLKRSAAPSSSVPTTKDLFAPRKKTHKDQTGSHSANPRQWAKNSATGEAYIDRAKARRVGKEDEDYSEVNRLAEEWQAKLSQAQSEEERREIEEQMSFLGGDSRHSILVKGLDHSLLAQQKAKDVEAEADADEVLEQTYDAVASTSSDDGPANSAGEKRSREAVIEALKRRRLTKASADSSNDLLTGNQEAQRQQGVVDAEFERAKQLGKFKPIKATTSAAGVEDKKGQVIITKDGKRLRKKKKTLPQQQLDEEAREKSSAPVISKQQAEGEGVGQKDAEKIGDTKDTAAAPSRSSAEPTGPSGTPPSLSKPAAPSQTAHALDSPPQLAVSSTALSADPTRSANAATGVFGEREGEDDDDDIFADAGRWEGLHSDDSDSDEDEGEVEKGQGNPSETSVPLQQSSPSTVDIAAPDASLQGATASVQGRNWFAEDSLSSSKGPDGAESRVPPLPAQINSLVSSAGIRTSPPSSSPPLPESKEEDESGPTASTGGRLQGLSTSSLPSNVSRMLLQAEEEEARRSSEKEKGWWKRKQEDRKRRKGEGEEVDEEDLGDNKGHHRKR